MGVRNIEEAAMSQKAQVQQARVREREERRGEILGSGEVGQEYEEPSQVLGRNCKIVIAMYISWE